MPTRHEMVRLFEQVVQQEITNHNEQILSTNMAIEEMRRQLKAQSVAHLAEIAALKSQLGLLDISIAKVDKMRRIDAQEANKNLSMAAKVLDKNSLLDALASKIDVIQGIYESQSRCIQKAQEEIKSVRGMAASLVTLIPEEMRAWDGDIKVIINELRSYLHERIDDCAHVQIAINQTLVEKGVDITCIRQEIQLLHKGILVLEKKFEYLTEQIKRIKGDEK